MRRPRAIATVVGVLMLALPAVAVAGSLDATSTDSFLTAATRLERDAIALHGPEVGSIDALAEHVQSACPDAVPASLANGSLAQQRTLGEFRDAAEFELALAELRPLRRAFRLDIARTAPLRWTSAELNRRVVAYVRSGRAALALHAPDLCVQARTAAQSDYTLAPRRIKAFVAGFETATPDSTPTAVGLAQRMKPLATHAELAAIKHLGRLQSTFERSLSNFTFRALGKLERALSGESGSRR